MAGVYNGYLTVTPSHRAVVPSMVNIAAVGVNPGPAALDLERATYYRRSVVPYSTSCASSQTSSCRSVVQMLRGDCVAWGGGGGREMADDPDFAIRPVVVSVFLIASRPEHYNTMH